jgi:DNA mismatch repair protein MLH1
LSSSRPGPSSHSAYKNGSPFPLSRSPPSSPGSIPPRLSPTHTQIIHRPSNAIKELLENSLDAGSTSIKISIKDGGLKSIQIADNGHGINKADLPLLCTRYATSKLREYKDLESIATYGFRGEALASISYCSLVEVVTKTKSDTCGWK